MLSTLRSYVERAITQQVAEGPLADALRKLVEASEALRNLVEGSGSSGTTSTAPAAIMSFQVTVTSAGPTPTVTVAPLPGSTQNATFVSAVETPAASGNWVVTFLLARPIPKLTRATTTGFHSETFVAISPLEAFSITLDADGTDFKILFTTQGSYSPGQPTIVVDYNAVLYQVV